MVYLQVIAGILFLLVARGLDTKWTDRRLVAWIVAVGLALRLCMFASTPMLEDDYYRYLWDGAVFAHGMNPYSYAPLDVMEMGEDRNEVPPGLKQLASESGLIVHRVNHPDLRTIYPLVAQGAFSFAHWIRPWSLAAWRLVLFSLDAIVVILLAVILRSLRLPLSMLVIYWWNPLLIKETYNSGHMDLVTLPFVLGALMLAANRRHVTAAGVLAVATGAKLWPAVLLPLALRPLLSTPKRLVLGLLVFGSVSFALFVPVYLSGLDFGSGFVAYGNKWEMNDALFMLPLWGFRFLARLLGGEIGWAGIAARIFVSFVLVGWVAWVLRKEPTNAKDLWEKGLFVVAAVFLLSPTQFPWYYVWLIPFLAIRPRFSLLLLTALLPLYYLRFYFLAHGNVNLFDHGIVWLEFVPVWILLIRDWHLGRRGRAEVSEAVT